MRHYRAKRQPASAPPQSSVNRFTPPPVIQPKAEAAELPEWQRANSYDLDILNLNATPIQAKLTIGEPNDKYEQEADQVAAQVVQRMNEPESVQREDLTEEELQMKPEVIQRELPEEEELQMKPESVQRQEAPEEEELQMKPQLQRQVVSGAVSPELEQSLNRAKSGGQALDPQIQAKMGQAMGADFSGVKVHTDSQADQLNQSIQAKAFTTGQDVFFRQGEYNPGSSSGQELIAHELTHVVQQQGAMVHRSPAPHPIIQRASGLPDKAELEQEGLKAGKSGSTFALILQELDEFRKTGDTDYLKQLKILDALSTHLAQWITSYEDNRKGQKILWLIPKVKSNDEAKYQKIKKIQRSISGLKENIQKLREKQYLEECYEKGSLKGMATEGLKGLLSEKSISQNKDNEGQILRNNNEAIRMLTTYTQKIGEDFFLKTVLPTLEKISDLGNIDVGEDSQYSKEDIKKVITIYENILAKILNIDAVPDSLAEWCYEMYSTSIQQGASQKGSFDIIASMLFLRVINPITVDLRQTTGKNQEKSFSLLSKILQNQANGVDFGKKEVKMQPFNEILNEKKEKMSDFVNQIIKKGEQAGEQAKVRQQRNKRKMQKRVKVEK
ncbi:MAG: DUF4157 domain-containing protein [Spirulina sp. DLM2.Bin59]|nr:MAG: DUF4157 domain-containing protein [Spirulina sp. DLM2.Bin59]